jgi:hypothetical protein
MISRIPASRQALRLQGESSMKRTEDQIQRPIALGAVLSLVLLAAISGTPAEESTGGDAGQELFLAQKCNMCHAVAKAGIEAKTKSEKMKGPELPARSYDAAELGKFLAKEGQIDDKDHKGKAFKMSEEELATLVAWLEQQK